MYTDVDHSEYDALLHRDQQSVFALIKENSAVWHLGRTLKGMYAAMVTHGIDHGKVDFRAIEWTRQPLLKDYQFMSARLNAYAERLRILADKTRAFGATPIFVTQPSRHYRVLPEGVEGYAEPKIYEGHTINGVDYRHMTRQFDQVLLRTCREKQALCIDLGALNSWEDLDFYDFVHMTPRGARKVGLELYERLRKVVNSRSSGMRGSSCLTDEAHAKADQ